MTYQLLLGDCQELLKTLPDNSVDSVVTDPPYGLSNHKTDEVVECLSAWISGKPYEPKGKGFMGKSWDAWVPGPEIWRECLRVLKPGGHILAFAGTRSMDLMSMGIRLAGFELRDSIGYAHGGGAPLLAWAYGCLSEDTQIATPDGLKLYTSIKPNDLVLCYDKYTQEYSYMPVEKVYEYNIKDTAYRIQSDHTDQIVSKNHRCIIERSGKEIFSFAEELRPQENIPFLENLPELQQTISNLYRQTNSQKSLLQTMFQRINWQGKYWNNTRERAYWYETTYLSSMWNYISQKYKTFTESKCTNLFKTMQWNFAWSGLETTRTQGQSSVVGKIGTRFSGKNDWTDKSCLEGRSDISSSARQSQRGEICEMPTGISSNGEEGRVYNGASFNSGTALEQNANTNRSGASHKSRSIRQSFGELDVICDESGTQVIRGWKGHKTTLATITPIEYEGKIWCVKVPTGAFVASRNGKAFVTGNSGFPKSLDVSKAIDKAGGLSPKQQSIILKQKREESGMSRDAVASIIGCTSSSIRDWEEGRAREKGGPIEFIIPSEEYRDRLATLFGYSSDERIESGLSTDRRGDGSVYNVGHSGVTREGGNTEKSAAWKGWGTALKPAWEPIILARKPLEGTVAENVLAYGTGALNIDACRIPTSDKLSGGNNSADVDRTGKNEGWQRPWMNDEEAAAKAAERSRESTARSEALGRWPANIIHNGSDEVVSLFPDSKGQQGDVRGTEKSHTGDENTVTYGEYGRVPFKKREEAESSAARFFYCAKASKADRNEGLDELKKYIVDENTPLDVLEKIKEHINTLNRSNEVLNEK